MALSERALVLSVEQALALALVLSVGVERALALALSVGVGIERALANNSKNDTKDVKHNHTCYIAIF
jgi:hypothetical protein